MKSMANVALWLVLPTLVCCKAGCVDSGRWSIGTKIGTMGVTGELRNSEANQDAIIDDNTYIPAQVSILSSRFDFNHASPYIGISWSNLIGRSRRWYFYSDLGVAFDDSPDVVLRANGTQAADPAFQADLAREAIDTTNNLDDFEVYPVISVGLYSRF